MKNSYLFYLFILCCMVLSCSQNREDALDGIQMKEQSMEVPNTDEPPPPPPSDGSLLGEHKKDLKIIKSGSLELEVESLETSKGKIDSIVKGYSGFYESEFYDTESYQSTFDLAIRVPTGSMDKLLQSLQSGMGKVIKVNLSAKDVTNQFVDLELRLENKEAFIEQYKSLLKRAGSIKDILEVQEKIRYIVEEVESAKGQLKFLGDKVQFATLNVKLIKKRSFNEVEVPGFFSDFADSIVDGFDGFLEFIVFIANFWVFILLLVLAFFVKRRYF